MIGSSRFQGGTVRTCAALAIACLAGGCQAVTEEWSDQQSIPASQSPIRFDHPDFAPQLAEYWVQREPKSGDTFYAASFAGAEANAVVTVYQPGPSYVIREQATESYVGPLLADSEPVWGESGRTVVRGSPVSYRMFGLPGESASCVGFAELIGQPADDANDAKSVIYGYFCESDLRPMSTSIANGLISRVSYTRSR